MMATSNSLLPPNATFLERHVEQVFTRVTAVPALADTMWNPETCPTPFLPWLAWALSVDDWDAAWTEERKREVIAASVKIHRHKGTLWAARRALAAMGYGDCRITEGWQTFVGGPWHVGEATVPVGGAGHWAEYWVTVSKPVTPKMVTSIRARLGSVAPARCRLTKVIVDAVATVVGGPWLVAEPTITVGATYNFEEITDGIAA